MIISLETKIKDKIMNEFNEDLYRKLNMTLSDANELYGWGFGYMYKIMNRVFNNYGPIGLKRETKYIVQYLQFLLNKLKYIYSLNEKQLPHYRPDHDHEFYKLYFSLTYYLRYYRHYGHRKIEHPDQLSFNFKLRIK